MTNPTVPDPRPDVPPDERPEPTLSGRQKLWLLMLVLLKRMRFIAILAAVGLLIGKWDTVLNYWDKWTSPRQASQLTLAADEEFYCPMHPQVVRSTYEPNGDVPSCPICGMPLSIRKKGAPVSLAEGVTGRVQLSPERVQLAGIQTTPVDYRPMAREIQTVGSITFDETRLSRIVSRVEGYVEKLLVDRTFTVVHQGDPLAEIYSPQLYSTAKELLMATRSTATADLAASARKKLELLGVSPQEIEEIVASGKPSSTLVIRSPQTGYVVDKKVVVGASVDAKMTLFEVADLTTVWIEGEVYEKDIPFLQVGQRVEATVAAYPDRVFSGKVALVYPELDAATRTNRIRMELDNPRQELRPGMYATVRIETPLETIEPYKSMAAKSGRVLLTGQNTSTPPHLEFLVVPERAVIETGAKKVVYVEREPGTFEGVEVELGPRQGAYYPVLHGLTAGDRVAAAGGFLIDAETRLNPGAASTYFGASGGPHTHGAAPSNQPAAEKPAAEKPMTMPKTAAVAPSAADLANLSKLSEADRKLALAQKTCPITGAALGSMGVPVKITLGDRPVFLCCPGCIGKAKGDPEATLQKLSAPR